MKSLNKINCIMMTIVFSLLFVKCKNDNPITNIKGIDTNYKFISKESLVFDSIYTDVELFYLNKTKDSLYTIATAQKDNFIIRYRGWVINSRRHGDWYYEKVYKNQIITDSIVNYIVFCDKNPINTIKKFKNNYIDKSAGYFYEVEMKENVFVGDTLEIKLNFVFDTVHFEKAANEFYIFNPPALNDYCDATKYIVDSVPVYKNSTKMRFLMDEKGKIKLSGYYLLFPKKQREQFTATQVFTEINFEVK